MKNLVIVESPAKANTIAKYLGKDFSVLSSVGHIRDIPKKKDKNGIPPIDITNKFKTRYEIDPAKKKLISELKKAAKAANSVWLATDEDREGEAIAWHLCEVLGLDPETTKRIVFHEITKSAIVAAIENPRTINMKLVNAQQARRILDRLVGFDLSPIVQQKVPGGKSAGRVQSPAVRLLSEREQEISQFTPSESFKITASFATEQDNLFSAVYNKKPVTEQEAEEHIQNFIGAVFTVSSYTTSPGLRSPNAPYTTSSLQQDAAARLSFSVKATMNAAQKLYQSGKITYMRTDSVNLSEEAITSISRYISQEFGKNYLHQRRYKTKDSSAQEAHEAIRPTDIAVEQASSDPYEQKLYSLIRSRTLASQMSAAKLQKTVVQIVASSKNSGVFETSGEVIEFDGFLRAYSESGFKDTELPKLAVGQTLDAQKIEARQQYSRPPARFSEGSLVKKLEELGIGRPSTYATIISTIQERGYAEKGTKEGAPRDITLITLVGSSVNKTTTSEKSGSDKNKLIPTPSGMIVSDFLKNNFSQVVDYQFTAHVEEDFDSIAQGKKQWYDMLEDFYTPFSELVGNAKNISRAEAAKAREIGKDPVSGKQIYARLGRFGPMLQLGNTEDEDKPRFAPLPKNTTLDTVTVEQAIPMFSLPKILGMYKDGQEIIVNNGRFGPYIQLGKIYVSIKGHDPHSITLNEAIQQIEDKKEQDAKKVINEFGKGIRILNGIYGPYITDGKKNAKIPKDKDAHSITEKEAIEILKNSASTSKKRFSRQRKK